MSMDARLFFLLVVSSSSLSGATRAGCATFSSARERDLRLARRGRDATPPALANRFAAFVERPMLSRNGDNPHTQTCCPASCATRNTTRLSPETTHTCIHQ